MTSKCNGLPAPDARAGRFGMPDPRAGLYAGGPGLLAADGEVRADLHFHSTCSDGLRTPKELARMAWLAKLTHIALCDHDAVEGNAALRQALDALALELAAQAEDAAAAALKRRLRGQGKHTGARDPFAGYIAPDVRAPRPVPSAVSGVELSCGADGRIHVLGYGVDDQSDELLAFLADAKKRRWLRGRATLDKLKELGLDVPEAYLPQGQSAPIGRAHIARALMRMGACNTVPQAFHRWLAEGRPAFVPQERPAAAEGVRLIRAAGGVPTLAHPMRLGLSEENVCALAEELTQAGLMGLEVYHSSSGRAETEFLHRLAARCGLLETGGSDYHGDQASSVRLGDHASGWEQERADVARLWGLCGR